MSALMRWEPLQGFELRNAMDRLFEDSFVLPRGWATPTFGSAVALDVYETKEDVVVQAALPGVKPDQVEITITGDTVLLRGQVEEEQERKHVEYVRREWRKGAFERCVTLPAGLKTDQAAAEFENGVLTLRVPKSEESKPKTVKVTTK